MNSKKGLLAGLPLLTFLLVTVPASYGQAPVRSWGIGGQIGDPSGIGVKYYTRPDAAYELLLSYDLDNYFLLSGRYLFEYEIPDSPLHYYLGPTLFFGGGDEAILGGGATFGLNFYQARFEVFLHVTPRINIIPDTEGDLGAGVGLHYYL